VLGNWCAQKLNDAGVDTHHPEGGFYLFPDFTSHGSKLMEKGISNSASLCARLLEDTGVAALPGLAFERPENELTARIAYVDFDGAKALTASETVPLDEPLPENFIDKWCHGVTRAIELIADWVK
jgi:aspartate aminotransferase